LLKKKLDFWDYFAILSLSHLSLSIRLDFETFESSVSSSLIWRREDDTVVTVVQLDIKIYEVFVKLWYPKTYFLYRKNGFV
jgi:hypothetical protein